METHVPPTNKHQVEVKWQLGFESQLAAGHEEVKM